MSLAQPAGHYALAKVKPATPRSAGRSARSTTRPRALQAAPGAVSTGAVTSGEAGLCLDDKSDSGTAGNKIEVWQCDGGVSQSWAVWDDGSLQVAGGCLATNGGGTTNGTLIVLEPCSSGAATQVWAQGNGQTLINPASGKCLEDPGASTTNGTQLDIDTCSTAADEQWGMPGSATGFVTDGITGECSDDKADSSSAGATVEIWQCNGGASQTWTAEANGTIQINSLCVEPTGAGTTQNTVLVLASCSGITAQDWAVGPDGWVWNVNAAMCLSDPNGSTTNGTQLIIAACNGTTQQDWRAPTVLDPSGQLANGVSGECADYQSPAAAIASCSGSPADFKLRNDGTIRTSGLCLAPLGGATADNTSMVVETCSGATGDVWAVGPDGWIWNIAANLCLSDPNASTTSGTKLIIATCNGLPQQTWTAPPTTVPAAPEGVTAAAGNAQATVSWLPPWSDGGSPINSYTVTASPGGSTATAAGTATSATVTGLTSGTAYTFTVLATTAVATSGSSAASASVTLASGPSAPTGVTATAGNTQATVTWTASSSNGGSAITGYTVTSVPSGGSATAGASATSATVTGLTNGTSYRFYVTARNANGTSPPSVSSNAVTPATVAVPTAPVITNVTARDSAAEVTWSPPDTGTSSLTGYVITVFSDGSQVSTSNEAASATDAIVSGLANGTEYAFTVAAVNSAGTGPASPTSAPVAPQPATAPMAPADVQVFPQNGEIQVGWAAPPDGGSAITGYTVSVSPADVAPVTTGAGTTMATISGLTDGTAYTVSVTATNAADTGPAGTAGPVTPAASIAPEAPTNLSATSTAAGAAELEWVPPASPGTSAITSYTLSASTGGSVAATMSAPASDCTGSPITCVATMTGLSSTSAYTFTVTATNSAGTSALSATTDAVTPDLIVSTTPVTLSDASVATLRNIDTDGTMYFEQPPTQVTGLSSGQLVRIAPSSSVPNGFLGKVNGVSTQAGLVTVGTSSATLADEYSALGASLNVPVNPAGVQTISALPGVKLDRTTESGRAVSDSPEDAGVHVAFADGTIVLSVDTDLLPGESEEGEDSDDTNIEDGPTASLEGTIKFHPDIDGSLDLPDVHLHVEGDFDSDIDAEIGVHLAKTETIPLWEGGDPEAVDTPIGPQDLTFTVDAVLSSDGTVGVSFGAKYEQDVDTTCTFNIVTVNSSDDKCTGSDTDNGSSLQAMSQLFGSMDEKVGVQTGVTWQFDEVAGPGVTFTPYVEATVNTKLNPWEDIYAGASIGANFAAFKDCAYIFCLPGPTLFSNNDVYNQKTYDFWNSGGQFQGMSISPNVISTPTGATTTFTATIPTGQVSPSSVTWSVIAGPGSIDSSGNYTSSTDGVAVIEATYNGYEARAGVVVGNFPEAPQIDDPPATTGLVNAIVTSWEPPLDGASPVSYVVTAQALSSLPGSDISSVAESTVVPYPETYAYLPNLSPNVAYSVTVAAVASDGTAVAAPPETATPLEPLPGALAGTGALEDAAVDPGTHESDPTGTAGDDGAAISADGLYLFYETEGRSPVAPSSISSPTGAEEAVVRQELVFPYTVSLASVDPNSLDEVNGGKIYASPDGSVAVFPPLYTGIENDDYYAYDFNTNTSWAIDNSAGVNIVGVENNGTVVYTTTEAGTTLSTFDHVYIQPMGGTAQQIDNCSSANGSQDSEDACGEGASMSANGDLIAYTGGDVGNTASGDRIFLYNAATGTTASLFPPNTANGDTLEAPVLSGDGTHISLIYEPSNGSEYYLVDKALDGSAITSSDGIASFEEDPNIDTPVQLDMTGNELVYSQENSETGAAYYKVYSSGSTENVPQLRSTWANSAALTSDGSELFYTLVQGDNEFDLNYPGVYEWQVP